MKEYTEGPWTTQFTKTEWLIVHHYTSHPKIIARVKTLPNVNTADADAQLISAAPELLEALQLYIDDCEMEKLEYNDDTYNAAKKALAKVEGNKHVEI